MNKYVKYIIHSYLVILIAYTSIMLCFLRKWETNYLIAEETLKLFRHFIDTVKWSTTK